MPELHKLVPDANQLISMTAPELGAYILECLSNGPPRNAMGMHSLVNFVGDLDRNFAWQSREEQQSAHIAVSAAWMWLKTNGLLCPDPGANPSWDWITHLGKQVRDRAGVEALLDNQELPEHQLHPALLADVRPMFLQRRFDTAVFTAFKILEVAVREAAGLGADKIGTKLMSEAFHSENGQLTDKNLEAGERVALQQLMAGAIGSYKNPTSHRNVDLSADEAREMIILASHLIKIVESRRK